MQNIYIFGSDGQDGRILKDKIFKDKSESNLFLFSKNEITYIKNCKVFQKKIINNNTEYISLLEKLLGDFIPDIVYYFAAVHISSTEDENNINKDDMFFTNLGLVFYLISKCQQMSKDIKFLFTSSSLIFSNSYKSPQNEKTTRSPHCYYSRQKVIIENLLSNISLNSNLKCYVPIMYNHESIYRKNRFFTKKIISFCSDLAKKKIQDKSSTITLFNPESVIDMGYAPEYIDFMMDLVSRENSGSYIFSSGNPIKVKEFVRNVLDFYNLSEESIIYKNMKPRFRVDLIGNNEKITKRLGRSPQLYGCLLAKKLCSDYENQISG